MRRSDACSSKRMRIPSHPLPSLPPSPSPSPTATCARAAAWPPPKVAQHMVGKEYVRPMVAFLTKNWATIRARHRPQEADADTAHESLTTEGVNRSLLRPLTGLLRTDGLSSSHCGAGYPAFEGTRRRDIRRRYRIVRHVEPFGVEMVDSDVPQHDAERGGQPCRALDEVASIGSSPSWYHRRSRTQRLVYTPLHADRRRALKMYDQPPTRRGG